MDGAPRDACEEVLVIVRDWKREMRRNAERCVTIREREDGPNNGDGARFVTVTVGYGTPEPGGEQPIRVTAMLLPSPREARTFAKDAMNLLGTYHGIYGRVIWGRDAFDRLLELAVAQSARALERITA